jgi:hypothetical protein
MKDVQQIVQLKWAWRSMSQVTEEITYSDEITLFISLE